MFNGKIFKKFFTISGGRLYRKVFIMMALGSVLPIILLGAIALYSLNLAHRLDVESIETNLLNQKKEEINNFFSETIGAFELRVAYEQTVEIELSQQNFLLRELLKENPSLEEVSFLNLTGRETAKWSRTKEGNIIEGRLQDQSRVEKFLSAKGGKTYISPVHLTLKGPVLTIVSPVRNKNGVIISYLAGEINLSGLQKLVEKSRLGALGYVYVLDQDGFLIAHSKLNEIGFKETSELYFVNFKQFNFGEKFTGNRYKSFLGEKVVASADYLPVYNLGIVAEWPLADAYKIINTIMNQIITFSIFVVLASSILSIFLANRIVEPIKKLEIGTRLISEGKFDKPVIISTNDELEDLGNAFNKMMEGLKHLEELKNEFVFIAAHELRTPVTAIKGFVSLVTEKAAGAISKEAGKFLGEIKKASDRLNNLVNDLLQIARSEAGRLEIKVVPTDITEPIRAVLAELNVLADEKGIQIIYEPGTLPQVLADPARLKEIMVNLVGNAIKYTLGGGGTVTISHEVNGNELITHVKDTGIGIPKEAQKKLFEKFYRVQDKRTREIIGTGLGLFIVKQIIEKMGGKIWFESEENKGSTFSFSLPIA